jgi:hypothetical protein
VTNPEVRSSYVVSVYAIYMHDYQCSCLLEPVNRTDPVVPLKEAKSLQESHSKGGEQTLDPPIFPLGPSSHRELFPVTLVAAPAKGDPPIKTKSGNAFINMSKRLLNNTPWQGEALNPGLVNLGNSCYFNSTLQGVSNLIGTQGRFLTQCNSSFQPHYWKI